MESNNIFDALGSAFSRLNISEEQKNELMRELLKFNGQKVNIMITGATGCGKSSTINAMFKKTLAKVGVSPKPETLDIARYVYGDNVILWDTPGLGDTPEKDKMYKENMVRKLKERDNNGNLLIDLVLVILDGSSPKNLSTAYTIIDEIVPYLGKEKNDREKRLLIAINKADMAKSGHNWNRELNEPDEVLKKYLDELAESVKQRMKSVGVDIVQPVYYSAGYMDDDGKQDRPYNLSKLLTFILRYTPQEKRIAVVEKVNVENIRQGTNDYDDDVDWNKENNTMLGDAIEYVGNGIADVCETFSKPLAKAVRVCTKVVRKAFDFFFG